MSGSVDTADGLVAPIQKSGFARDSHNFSVLKELEKKVMWLSAWMIHEANHLRPARDGLKVGGHQASCASVVTLMTALYFHALRPMDRVAVKPHASPVFHAIQYLLGRQKKENIALFRGFGGAQSYPSRTKDSDDVDISTGSVGLGGALTVFASLAQDYIRLHSLGPSGREEGRMIALFGDAELDEGNVFEALFEGWKHDVRNVWWVIDYNRQSLDSVVTDPVFHRLDGLFRSMDWNVQTIKYGQLLQSASVRAGGDALIDWIDSCPNQLYSALTFKGGAAWRKRLKADLGDTCGIGSLLQDYDNEGLHALMTNLAGHDLGTVLEAYSQAAESDVPTCIIAYTIKGYGLPLAGHKDNHAGLMSVDQMKHFQELNGVAEGEEWDHFSGLRVTPSEVQQFLQNVPFSASTARRFVSSTVDVPSELKYPVSTRGSTQEAFGRVLNELGRGDSRLAERIVTTSPDVTVSTNLGPWVNRRQIFDLSERPDVFRSEDVASAQKWVMSPTGQHIELGIAENNLFLMLAALGLSNEWFGARLLPVGTLYDPFVARGLDALNYACYQDSRFMLIGTPSGITLAPEGGAHQSVSTPLIGMGQPGLTYFEPAYIDELAIIMRWGFEYMQLPEGGSVYLRLSTRPIDQVSRTSDSSLVEQVISGAYWKKRPTTGAELAIVYCGAVAPEAEAAYDELSEEIPGLGLLAVTSPDRLHSDWLYAKRRRREQRDEASAGIEKILHCLAPDAGLITIIDGHPATLSWLGAVSGHRVYPLGVEMFGQSGDINDLYEHYGLDTEAILEAAARASLRRISSSNKVFRAA